MNIELTVLAAIWPILSDVLGFIWSVLPRTVTEALVWQFIYLPLILAAAYPVAIQYERGGWWKLLMPLALVVAIIDVYLNFTTFSLVLWSTPGKKEYTFSEHLERLVFEQNLRGFVARIIARYTNIFDPTPPHIALP